MSTIRVDNFGPSAGGTTYSARGIAKAWCRFNGTDTIAIESSSNTSSLTDVGTGDYQINLTNALNANDGAHFFACANFHSGRASIGSASIIRVFVANTSHTLADSSFVVGATFGDLA